MVVGGGNVGCIRSLVKKTNVSKTTAEDAKQSKPPKARNLVELMRFCFNERLKGQAEPNVQ